jgi:transaldolase
MKFFVDTADVSEISALAETGLVDGVTTNPTLIYQSGRDFLEVTKEICRLLPEKPVSAEVTALEAGEMIRQGEKLAAIADNVVIKLPLTLDGLKACKHFSSKGIMTNVTLCFSANQALLAAKAGASFISPFVGRLDDISYDGMDLIADIVTIYANYDFATEILVASVRHPVHVLEAAKLGAHVATLPPKVLKQLASHPLTEKGLASFMADWEKTGQKL